MIWKDFLGGGAWPSCGIHSFGCPPPLSRQSVNLICTIDLICPRYLPGPTSMLLLLLHDIVVWRLVVVYVTYDWVTVGVSHGVVQNEVSRLDLGGDTMGVCRGVHLSGVPSKHHVHLLVGHTPTCNVDCMQGILVIYSTFGANIYC